MPVMHGQVVHSNDTNYQSGNGAFDIASDSDESRAPSTGSMQLQNTPDLDASFDEESSDEKVPTLHIGTALEENVAADDNETELSTEAELLLTRFAGLIVDVNEDSANHTDDQIDGFQDISATEADQFDAQIVADMADLQHGTQQCYICTEDVCHSKVLQLACGEHWLCHNCIADPFEAAVQNESCYPPKCCDDNGPLRIEDIEHLLATSHPDLNSRYNAKLEEYHMDKRFRRYCGVQDCHTFLSPDSYEHNKEHNLTSADCPTCNRTTCIFCTKIVFKLMAHECESTATTMNVDYSQAARFKICPFCDRPGLLDDGCNHVTCECGEEWCFVCIRKWSGGYNHEACGQYNVCLPSSTLVTC